MFGVTPETKKPPEMQVPPRVCWFLVGTDRQLSAIKGHSLVSNEQQLIGI
jgi:hypothetical protein